MGWYGGVLSVFLALAVVNAAPIRPFGLRSTSVVETVYIEEGPGYAREGSGLDPDDDVFIGRPDTGNEVEAAVGHGMAGLSPAQMCRERWGRDLMECFHDYRRAMNDLGELLLSAEGQTLFCGVQMELYQCYQTVLDQPFCQQDNEIDSRRTKIQTDMRVIRQKCDDFR
ncbi:Hypp6411 [Branchiostoma lanceolatum]|uniref:Hypp6411 protein n=1 Tax=Branchiostoma lanceolatum TaxID=7740 RepID=A0A8J9YU34_BRALA|nr:Hypp6411 [Branchiostoma lanceolatum]